MKILYLAHRIPYPPNKGDKIRSFNEIKYLAAYHTVDLLCLADDPDDLQHEKALRRYCRNIFVCPMTTTWGKIMGLAGLFRGRSISVTYFYRGAVQERLNQWLAAENYDAVICFSSSMAEYVFKSRLLAPGHNRNQKQTKLIMDFCDVDSDKWLQYSRKAPFPLKQIYAAENHLLRSYEKKIYQTFDASIVVSELEKRLFLTLHPPARDLAVMPNGVDAAYFSPAPAPELPGLDEGPVLVFTGALDYHANVDGVCWFCESILPVLQRDSPTVQFYIVGRNPAPGIKKLNRKQGVHLITNVEDIRPWYQKADIYVVPLRLARGVQNKVLEAMAMERAVVTTSMANAGIQAGHEKDLIVADSPEEFVATISYLYKHVEKRRQLGENAREFVMENFDWQKNMKMLDNLLSQ